MLKCGLLIPFHLSRDTGWYCPQIEQKFRFDDFILEISLGKIEDNGLYGRRYPSGDRGKLEARADRRGAQGIVYGPTEDCSNSDDLFSEVARRCDSDKVSERISDR